MADFPARVDLHEEGPREGFQSEPAGFSIGDRAALVEALAASGLRQIQVASFVNPKRVPQMADAAELFAAIRRKPGVRYTGLWLNEQGFDRARATAQVDLVGTLYFYASDAFARANNGMGAAEFAERQRHARETADPRDHAGQCEQAAARSVLHQRERGHQLEQCAQQAERSDQVKQREAGQARRRRQQRDAEDEADDAFGKRLPPRHDARPVHFGWHHAPAARRDDAVQDGVDHRVGAEVACQGRPGAARAPATG